MELPFDLLLGRKTFDIWAPYWPLHDDLWPNVNKARKYVVSRTLRSHAWQPTTFIAGDVAREVRKLKEGAGLDLHVYGSAELFQTLFREELVDELWLRLHPITLGGGKRLFAEGSIPSVFTLAKSVVTTRGVLFLDYRR
jgi:dihydrofolate reductase